jgi:DNA-binding response OmpR family regulator
VTFDGDYRILFIEDDLDLTKVVQRMLSSWGAVVLTASTVSEATQFSADQSFDLILCDRHLPTGEAHDFLPGIVKNQPGSAVLICSGAEDASKFDFLGERYRFIQKPFGPKVLFAAVQAALQSARGPAPRRASNY